MTPELKKVASIRTRNAPEPVGPYSQAIHAGGFLFVAGQLPIDPNTGALVEGGITEQTARAVQNVAAVLHAAGLDLKHVVRCVVYMTNLDNFSDMNAVYARHFAGAYPARTTVEVARLPKNSLVEVEATAVG